MKLLDRLREETAELHQQLEAENLANRIMDHSISLDEYKTLLYQNFLAYSAAETAINAYLPIDNEKNSRLRADLAGLGVNDLTSYLSFTCNSEAEAIGAAYVIEGSAMGGLLIGNQLKNNEALEGIPEQEFFNGSRDSMKGWNRYLKFLRSREFTDAQIEVAALKARATFLLFKEAFNIELTRSC